MLDFGDSKRDVIQITQNIFAVGRQAQAIGFQGPILGHKFNITREDQLRLEAQKEEERRIEEERAAQYEEVMSTHVLLAFRRSDDLFFCHRTEKLAVNF